MSSLRSLSLAALAVSIAIVSLSCSRTPSGDPSLPGIDVGDSGGGGDTTGDSGHDPRAADRAAIEAIPETARYEIPGLSGPVHVVRTEMDVPHIYASNRRDMYVAEGFVLARDRYFEFEAAQRLAQGTIGELLGDFGLIADLQARGQGMAIVANRIHESLDEKTGEAFDAYAEGVNAYIEEVRAGRLPPPSEIELTKTLLGVENPADAMEPVNRRDIAGFAAFAVFTSSHTDTDLLRSISEAQIEGHFAGAPDETLRQAGLADDLWGSIAPVHPIAVVPGFGLNGERQRLLGLRDSVTVAKSFARPIPRPMVDRVRRRSERSERWFRFGSRGDHGSNAWAVAGSETTDGSALLAGDGHLSLGVPPIFFQMGLDASVFAPDDDLSLMGLFLPGFPFMAVGTNGHVAWSQTYPRADVVDWYREEIRLDASGNPAESLFRGEWKPLVRIDETYKVAPVLGSTEREETWARWTTFDGRFLMEIEGRTVEDVDAEVLAGGEAIVTMLGDFIVPEDLDGDGVITAISSDYTAYDMGDLAATVAGFQDAMSVEEFQSAVANFVGYAQNLVSADAEGHIGFTPFTATPCRGYLDRDANGEFAEGADPALLLDGTRYGAFEIPLTEDRRPDFAAGANDPAKCIIPYDDFPRAYDPAPGWVANANNDPAGASFDDTWAGDLWYIGGPWVPGYRARAITMGLEAAAADDSADIAKMAELQAHHQSQVGEEYVPLLFAAMDRSEALANGNGTLEDHEVRLADAWDPRFEAVRQRLQAWLDAGAYAKSGVHTFYATPTEADQEAAVATMIFNAWFRQYLRALFDDEAIDFVFQPSGRQRGQVMRALKRMHEGRGAGNPLGLASYNPATAESIYFDDMSTPEIERSDEVMLAALTAALDELTSDDGVGFGTADMSQWLWGLRHFVKFESILAAFAGGNPAIGVIGRQFAINTKVLPLAEDLAADDPRKGLTWFPRDGDLFGVDAANPAFFGEDDFSYVDGPVMRMVIAVGPDGVRGQNIIPGGQSGLKDSPHYADQAALWLANDTIPMRYSVADVVAGAVGRELLAPSSR